MKSEIIIMLTHNDQTVENALEVFNSCKDLPVKYWGFKDVGLPKDKMQELHDAMKTAGKETFLEVVTYTSEECMKGAQLAVEFGYDYLMGTIMYPEVWDYLKDKPIKYLPFVGEVSGSPSVLGGSIKSMVAQAQEFSKMGIHGVDILAYRATDADPAELAKALVDQTDFVICVAGSIGSEERIKIVDSINPWTFTMGSALFTKNFVPNGNFRENLEKVIEIMGGIKD